MRNIVAYVACGLVIAGFALLVVFCGMLDAPEAPLGPAVLMGIAALCTMGAGSALANLYERGRI